MPSINCMYFFLLSKRLQNMEEVTFKIDLVMIDSHLQIICQFLSSRCEIS